MKRKTKRVGRPRKNPQPKQTSDGWQKSLTELGQEIDKLETRLNRIREQQAVLQQEREVLLSRLQNGLYMELTKINGELEQLKVAD